jgi:hypothetical protein
MSRDGSQQAEFSLELRAVTVHRVGRGKRNRCGGHPAFEIVNSFLPSARHYSLRRSPQIFKKIFLRYIQNRMNQKISSTANP